MSVFVAEVGDKGALHAREVLEDPARDCCVELSLPERVETAMAGEEALAAHRTVNPVGRQKRKGL